MNREELAWAAGFFDGEGHVGLYTVNSSRSGRAKRFKVSVNQRHIEPLERFQRALGGIGRIYTHTDRDYGRPVYTWRATNYEHKQAALVMLWSFLCSVKRDQALEALTKYHLWKKDDD